MEKNKNDKQEPVEFLRSLLNEEYEEKKAIAKELHDVKGLLAFVNREKNKPEIAVKREENDLKLIEEQQTLNECRQILQKIHSKLYPVTLNYSGILIGIKQYVFDYKRHYLTTHQKECPFMIYLDVEDHQTEKLGNIHDIRIYKSLTEILDYLFICSPKIITLKMDLSAGKFKLGISAHVGETDIKTPETLKKMDLIKARLIWAKALVMKETNWKDLFSFTFDMK